MPPIAAVESKQSSEGRIERRYDPTWARALNFLDEIGARGMLARSTEGASLGSLLLLRGSIAIVNMRAFERVWSALAAPNPSPSQPQNRKARRASVKSPNAAGNEIDEETAQALKLFGSLDQPILMVFDTGEVRLWSTLIDSNLLGGARDLNLKHGLVIPGDWHIVGILDGKPDTPDGSPAEFTNFCGSENNDFSVAAAHLWRELRAVIGRPPDCFGITPLVIMREVA